MFVKFGTTKWAGFFCKDQSAPKKIEPTPMRSCTEKCGMSPQHFKADNFEDDSVYGWGVTCNA